MKAGENYLVKFMQQQDTQFIIPVYQRNYDWARKHCEQLLFDIKEVAKAETVPSHFIGSIRLFQEWSRAKFPKHGTKHYKNCTRR